MIIQKHKHYVIHNNNITIEIITVNINSTLSGSPMVFIKIKIGTFSFKLLVEK